MTHGSASAIPLRSSSDAGRLSSRVIALMPGSFARRRGALRRVHELVWAGSGVLVATLNVFLFAFDRP